MLYILTPIFCVSLLCGAVFSFSDNNKVSAEAYSTLPTGTNAIGNIYNSKTEKFSVNNLNKLAQKLGASYDIKTMVAAAEGGTVKTSADFGETVVKFGYANNGSGAELDWIPAYLSKDTSGNAILTLWLATTSSSNSGSNQQEISKFTDGTLNNSTTPNPSSNNYATSYIRALINNGGTYYGGWNSSNNSVNPTIRTLNASNDNKFAMFATGKLSSYLIAPSQVNWQISSKRTKNDAGWAGNANGHYTSTWTNDKLWLPSLYEVHDKTIAVNSVSTTFINNGGLWEISQQKASNTPSSWTRTGCAVNYDHGYRIGPNSAYYLQQCSLEYGVRPALHLNLSSALNNAEIDVPQDISVTYDGNSKWITDLSTAEKPAWLDLGIYNKAAYTSVNSVEYTDNLGNAATIVTTSDIKAAGTYKVTMTLVSDFKWTGESTTGGDKSFNIVIAKGEPKVTPKFPSPLPTYVPDELPAISLSEGDTAGTIAWDKDQQIKSGTNDYKWTFTPSEENKNNFKELHKTSQFTFEERAIEKVTITSFDSKGKTVFTSTLPSVIKSYMTVEVKYYEIEKTTEIKDFELQINNDNKLKVGDNKLKVKYNGKWSAEFTISGVEELTFTSIESITLSKNEFTYPVTVEQIVAVVTAVDTQRNDGTAYALTAEEIKSLIVLADGSDLTAGTRDLTFKIKDTEASTTYEVVINKGIYEMSGITFGGLTMTYDGSAHKIEISGTLPEGVSVVYSVAGETATEFTNAGTYAYTASFTHSNPNYNAITTTLPATLKIEQKEVDMSGVEFKNAQKYANGDSYTLEITGTLPTTPAVSVSYTVEGVTDGTLSFSEEGTYKFTAKFTHSDPNYKPIADMKATLEITKKQLHDMTGVTASGGEKLTGDITNGFSGTYDGGEFEITIDNSTLPTSVAVDTVVYEKKQADGSWIAVVGKPSGAGEYRVKVSFTNSDPAYATPQDIEILLTVDKADIDTSNTEFAPAGGEESGLKPAADGKGFTGTYKEDGDYEVDIDPATLPAGTQKKGAPVYKKLKDGGNPANPDDWTVVSKPDGSGTYKVVFELEPTDTDNYNEIDPIEIPLVLSDRVVEKVTATVDTDAKFDINSTLDDLKKVISAEVEYNNGTKEAVAVDNLTLACDTLRDGGKFEVGAQTVTITYNDGTKDFTTTVEIVVAKAKVALPVYKGTLSYTGLELKPTANDFDGYNADIMTFNETKTIAGLNAGAYKAVFALKDSDRYEWATTTSLKKSVFAAAVFDGETEIALGANEAAVDWNIAKAKISATKAEGKLPVFASESFTGSLGEVIALKYYTDETCTEEVAADALGYNTNYYVRAVLSDEAKANFELDETSLVFAAKPFEYLTPEKELTVWEKIVVFLKANWLWIVIAVVALILLITIIALAAKHAKKKRLLAEKKEALEEQRRLEKEERDREERRLEREERMARMNQQQAMPQMMMPQMPQYMPQAMPQSAQPMAMGGGADNAQLARIEAELSNVMSRIDDKIDKLKSDIKIEKLENAMSNGEIAALRNDVNSMRNDFTYVKRDGQIVQGGISLDKLTEFIRTEVNNAFDSREKAAQSAPATTDSGAANASPVAAQVPPDAVMTTVTTTKIDTTKKAQGTHDSAQPTRQTRSFVPPMPVDDGRVFDVGGFYKPADPMDLESGEEDK